MALLNFGTETFPLDDDGPIADLAADIGDLLRQGGGWKDIPTRGGVVSLLISPGVPIWIKQDAADDNVTAAFA